MSDSLKTQHNWDWVISPYGHGEWACTYCKAPKWEIAIIGDLNRCLARAKMEQLK